MKHSIRLTDEQLVLVKHAVYQFQKSSSDELNKIVADDTGKRLLLAYLSGELAHTIRTADVSEHILLAIAKTDKASNSRRALVQEIADNLKSIENWKRILEEIDNKEVLKIDDYRKLLENQEGD